MKKFIVIVFASLGFAASMAHALLLEVNPNTQGDWVFHLTGTHDGSGVAYYESLNIPAVTTVWNGQQGGSDVQFEHDSVESFYVYPANSDIVNAYDIGDGFVVGDTDFKGFYIGQYGVNLKFDPSFSQSSFTSTTFDQTVVLKPADKTMANYNSIWKTTGVNDTLNYTDGQFSMKVSNQVIPEPAAIGLLGSSCSGLFLLRSLRRRKMAGATLLPVRRERRCDVFCSDSEWMERRTAVEEPEPTVFDLAVSYAIDEIAEVWGRVRSLFSRADKNFWNFMVDRHERRLIKRAEFRVAAKKRFLNGLDSFLALIMK